MMKRVIPAAALAVTLAAGEASAGPRAEPIPICASVEQFFGVEQVRYVPAIAADTPRPSLMKAINAVVGKLRSIWPTRELPIKKARKLTLF